MGLPTETRQDQFLSEKGQETRGAGNLQQSACGSVELKRRPWPVESISEDNTTYGILSDGTEPRLRPSYSPEVRVAVRLSGPSRRKSPTPKTDSERSDVAI